MPADKHTNGNPAKPFTPALSSHFRSTKSPLTPKLIGSAQSSPGLSPRREIHNRTAPPGRDEPVASPLNGNITPRSGTRNSRIGTESPSTPGGGKGSTAGRVRAVSINETLKRGTNTGGQSAGLGISSPGARSDALSKPISGFSGVESPTSIAGRPLAIEVPDPERDVSPQFFRASEAKGMVGGDEVREKPKLGPKSATFFYASESTSSLSVKTDPPRTNSLGTIKNDDSKFFHANDVPTTASKQAPIRPTLTKKYSSSAANSPRMQSPDPQQSTWARPRAPSPLKDQQYRSGTTSPTSPQRKLNKSSSSSTDIRSNLDRRKSIGSNMSARFQPGHQKSASTTSSTLNLTHLRKATPPKILTTSRIDSSATSRATIVAESRHPTHLLDFPASPDSLSPRSTSLTSSNTLATSDTDRSESTRLQSPIEIKSPITIFPQSPNSAPLPPPTPQPPLQKANELAAAARRERKVLDLEISNSSLLAINKTLEREMRKQSAELRRFRRLSRSGRLSIATAGSLRTASGASGLSTLSEDAEDLPNPDADDIFDGLNDFDISSGDSDDDLESTLSTTSSSNPAASLSPTSRTQRRRRRDEKRLLLDLSKHQQLLIDSQKLNQSIRRCQGFTEEMIRDGERALVYQVGIGDLKLGGRVLREDEGEHTDAEEHAVVAVGRPVLAQGARDMKTLMEEAMNWAGPGSMQAFDGTTSRDSPTLSPER